MPTRIFPKSNGLDSEKHTPTQAERSMLSIFTLTVLGAFGVSNALTDVSDRTEDDEDEGDDGLHGDGGTEGLGGNEDLIERLDMYAALGMKDRGDTPTSEAYLPAEEPEDEDDIFEATVISELTSEEVDALAGPLRAEVLPDVPDDAPTEVISVAVGGPGSGMPDATESGFRTQLGPQDELTLNIAPDLPGQILAVHSVYDSEAGGQGSVGLRYSLNFYMLPEGQVVPEGSVTGTEAEFIESHGLQKLGEVDLGRFEARLDPGSGDTIVTDDSRQVEPPHILSNRPVTEITALFG